MDCDTTRRALSAEIDGEEAGVDTTDLATHLAECAGCARWYEQATRIGRLARLGPARHSPDVADQVLAQVRLPRRMRARTWLAAAVIVVAVAQLGVGLVNLFAPVGMPPEQLPAGQHMNHESAAFNVAFAAALLAVGVNTRRATSHLPVLASFVAVLATASLIDLAAGEVEWLRLATHLPIVTGLVLTLLLVRTQPPIPGPVGRRGHPTTAAADAHAGRSGVAPPPAAPPGDVRPGHQPPAARRHVA